MCEITDWIILCLLGACSVSDIKRKTIPVYLLVILSIVTGVFAVFCDRVSVRLRVAGILLGLLFLLISKCTKEAIGYGDSWLILLMGLYLGYLCATAVLFAASVLAGIASLFFLWKYRWRRSVTLPFVPFLTISYLGAMFL